MGVRVQCTDDLLREIGKNCNQLRILDISKSKVTDQGIRHLTQVWECRAPELQEEEDMIATSSRSLPLFQHSTRSVTKSCSSSTDHVCCFKCYKTKLCHTLRSITLYETNITVEGLMSLFGSINDLEIVKLFLDKFLDELYDKYSETLAVFPLPSWKINFAQVKHLTDKRLKMLLMLMSQNNSVSVLKVESGFLKDSGLASNNFMNYFMMHGASLQKLQLTYLCDDSEFDLSFIMMYCPNLVSLDLCAGATELTWSVNKKPVLIPKLKYATFMSNINSDVAVLFLESAMRLKGISFSYVNNDENLLLTLCETNISSELMMFYVDLSDALNNPQHVARFWQRYQHINKLYR